MRYTITGRHLNVGAELRQHTEAKLASTAEKYGLRPIEAVAVLSRQSHGHSCEINVRLSSGLNAQASASAGDVFSAVDESCNRMDKQLRRYKRRLKNHHNERTTPVEFREAPSYVLESADHGAEDTEPETLQPVIIAENETRIPTLSVGEAVMQLELAEAPVLVFHNQSDGGINVVYRRDDRNIGWIDPTSAAI